MTKEERDDRRELEEDLGEDLQLENESAEKVRGGQKVTASKAKTADKAFNAMDGYIRG